MVDSSAWTEWLVEGSLFKKLRKEIPSNEECVIPTIVQLELAKWLTRKVGEDKAAQFLAFTLTCQIVPLDTRLALRAAELCRAHRLSTADSIVYATALDQDADLVTCDAHFAALEHVLYVPKAGA